MEKNKIGQLCHWLIRQPEGRELLQEIRMGLANDPIFPKHPDLLAQFGGANNYAAFRAGQAYMLRVVELHAQGFVDQENALKAKANKAEVAKAVKEKKR